jgi:hypothetical protein
MKVRRMAAGLYEIDTDKGTHTIARLTVTKGMTGFEHRRPGVYWLHTPAGEYSPSGEFAAMGDATAYVRRHYSAPATRYTVDCVGGRLFRVLDTVAGMDVCTGTRERCTIDADALNAGTLSLDSFGRIVR